MRIGKRLTNFPTGLESFSYRYSSQKVRRSSTHTFGERIMPMNSAPLRSRRRIAFALVAALCAAFIVVYPSFFARSVKATSSTILISEFRTRGPAGANDEFIELYNATNAPIDIGGWKINRSNGTGTINTQVTITAGTM